MIECKQFAEDLAFDLFDKIIDGVAVNEGPFLGVVGVQVEVEGQSVRFD